MPAFAPGFKHDIFISYGCVDNQSGVNGEPGWVSSFAVDLERRLSERLGRKDNFTIWRDEEQLAKNVDLSEQISDAIHCSACLIVVLSPGYLKSDWCKTERTDFLKQLGDRDTSGSRVFVVERDWIEVSKPEQFKNLLGFKFWTGDPTNKSNLPRPLDKSRPSDSSEYKDQLNAVALALEAELIRLKPAALSQEVTSQATKVFLAEVTDDMRPQWKKVRNELEQRGFRVVSGGAARDAASLESAVKEGLADSQLFVQLLGQFPGQILFGSDETYVMMQYRLAVDLNKRIVQWRSPLLTEEVFDAAELEDPVLTQRYRQMVFGKVRAEHIEDFKTYMIKAASEKPQSDIVPIGDGLAFVSFDSESCEDARLGTDLCNLLEMKGFNVVLPVGSHDANPTEIRADFEKYVLSSHGWIVVYGEKKNQPWARGQLTDIFKLLAQSKCREKTIHLCAGPPAPKAVDNPLTLVGMKLRQMKVLNCQNGFEPEQFTPFVDSLTANLKSLKVQAVREAESAHV